MKLLNMYISPLSSHFISCKAKMLLSVLRSQFYQFMVILQRQE